MEHTQARMLLRKINQIFEAVVDSGSEPSRIEVDLLQDYTRQFYAAILSDSTVKETPKAISDPRGAPAVSPAKEAMVQAEKLPEIKPVVEVEVADPKPVQVPVTPPIPTEKEEVVLPPSPAPVVQSISEERDAPSNGTRTIDTILPVKKSSEADVLFATEEAKDLSGKLRTSPIEDLSRAMGINERFLTINELFHGDHEAFDQALRRLNDLPDFSAARAYLESEIIPRYDWLETKIQKKAGVFIQLVRRRYL